MRVIGLDLSLTSTGIADAAAEETRVLKPGQRRGYERLRWLKGEICALAFGADLVVVEGPSYGSPVSKQTGHHERAGLWWFVTEALSSRGFPMVIVSPSSLKKYATGSGQAGKDAVLIAASKRFCWFAGTNDEADALWLSAIGYDLGECSVIQVPERHREVLLKVDWLDAA